MNIQEWVSQNYKKYGRDWLQSNYNQCCTDLKEIVNRETYMRCIRRSVENEKEINDFPKTDYDNKISKEETKDAVSYIVNSSDIRTVEQLIDYCKVDMTLWEISKFICNPWGSEKNPNYQCKAWFVRKTEENREDIRKAFIDDLKEYALFYPIIEYPKYDVHNLLEICLFDLHYGQLSWAEETGRDYDIKIAEELFMKSVEYFANISRLYPIEKILFPIGNDFFNVNSKLNSTVNGTPQDEDTRYQKTYTNARRMLVKAIDYLQRIAPIDIIIVGGNHDQERSFMLGDSLYCWYHDCENVNVNNDPVKRKYYLYGKTLIGFSHGDNEKFEELPLLMATENKDNWALSDYREWHTGHLHKNEIMERQNVRIRRIPSMVVNSAWASEKGYNSVREAQAFLWNQDKGLMGVFNYRE